jgi:hypothetical protein
MWVMAFISMWILVQSWWAIVATRVSCKQTTPVYLYAYRGAAITLPFVMFSWWHPVVLLALLAAWYLINIDAWINLGTYDEPDLQDARHIKQIKFKNWILVAFIILVNTLVIFKMLMTCAKTLTEYWNG